MAFTEDEKKFLKQELCKRIASGHMDRLCIEPDGETFRCDVEGDLFAIIGALAHVLCEFGQHTNIPTHVLATYIGWACEMVQEVNMFMEQQKEDEQEQFTTFMNILTSGEEEEQ